MSFITLPGCSVPQPDLFRANSTLHLIFKEFDGMTRAVAVKSIIFIAIVYLFANIFHLIVLTRTSMNSLSVSKEMICIAVSGVITGIIGVSKNVVEVFEHEFRCSHSYFYHVFMLFHFLVFQTSNQIILWEIVYITFLRAAVVLEVRHGIKTSKLKIYMRRLIFTVFSIFFTNHLVRISFYRIMKTSDENKIKEALNGRLCSSEYVYIISSIAGNCLRRILLGVAGISSLITPISVMSIISIFLIFELRTSSSTVETSTSSNQKQNRAAQALLLFLCFYVLAELPYVVLYTIGVYNPADFEVLDEFIYTQVDIFIYVNMCLGILVYCLMSSQYRETVRMTFWRKKMSAVVEQSSRITS